MGFRHKLAYSFFDLTAYKEFLRQGLGKSIFYIFLVTIIFSTIVNIVTLSSFNSDISKVQAKFINEAPNFTLENGVLSIDSTQPIYYKHDGQTLIVDTSGATTLSALSPYNNGVYIDANSITFRQNYHTLKTLKFSDFADIGANNSTFGEALSIFKFMYNVTLLFIDPILSFLENLFSVFLILGPGTLIISSIIGFKLNYSKSCTLSFYAMTSSILIEALLNVAEIDIPEFYILYYIIALIYCVLAIKKIKNIDNSNLNVTK